VALEVTEEWHDPPDGKIETPDQGAVVLGAHAVRILSYDGELFRFVNPWGLSWGASGWGTIQPDYFDRFIVEAWCASGRGVEPPIKATSGLVSLLWKSTQRGHEVHGREIVDAASHERLAWTFLVRRGADLDIEEFFVWPSHRRKGYARKLVEMVRVLSRQMGTRLRAWVPFADAGQDNRGGLTRVLQMLGLNLHKSPNRSAAFLATGEPASELTAEPCIPERPAILRNKLDPAEAPRLYSVWFGTNRKPNDPTDGGSGFSGERDDRVHYGVCRVSIPKSHIFGSVGSGWFTRWRRATDDRLQVIERAERTADDFWRELEAELNRGDPNVRHGLVFLHGYRVDFDQAAIRAAQIGYDLKVPGVTAFFSWPSCGTLQGYPTDEACIEASEPFIADFLHDFVARSGATCVHLVAHSMGNRGLMRAIQRLAGRVGAECGVSFGQVILAAPDIDAAVFADLAQRLAECSQRTTLYASPADKAVAASRWLHTYPRAGLTPPVTVVPGIDTVEVPQFNILDFLGHGYFAEAAALLHDMFDLIRWNAPPDDRQRLAKAVTPEGLTYWTMTP
jgi:esterase/lipase superfamily enzyme